MARESFVIHTEYIEDLPDENKAEYLLYIYNYGSKGEEPNLTGLAQTIWIKIKRRMDEEEEAYNKKLNGNSNGGKNHKGNQYTRRNGSQLPNVPNDSEEMEVNGSCGSVYESVSVNEFESVNDTHTEEKTEISASVPAYIPQVSENRIKPQEFDRFAQEIYRIIQEHNSTHGNLHKIAVSKNYLNFKQKECLPLCSLVLKESPPSILEALKNYLLVADIDTWKESFTWNEFINKYLEYMPDYFHIDRFRKKDFKAEQNVDYTQVFADKNMQQKWFEYSVFHHHRQDWLDAGRPEGNDYIRLQEKWEREDDESGACINGIYQWEV